MVAIDYKIVRSSIYSDHCWVDGNSAITLARKAAVIMQVADARLMFWDAEHNWWLRSLN